MPINYYYRSDSINDYTKDFMICHTFYFSDSSIRSAVDFRLIPRLFPCRGFSRIFQDFRCHEFLRSFKNILTRFNLCRSSSLFLKARKFIPSYAVICSQYVLQIFYRRLQMSVSSVSYFYMSLNFFL